MVSDTFAPGPGRTYHIRIGDRRYEVKPGFAELALNTGAAVIPVFGRFIERSRLLLEFRPALEAGAGTREQQIQSLITQFEQFANQTLRQYPDMVLWKRMAVHLKRSRLPGDTGQPRAHNPAGN